MARTAQVFNEIDRLVLSSGEALSRARVLRTIERHEGAARARMDQLWAYYRNPMQAEAVVVVGSQPGRGYRLAQERGLPARVVGAWDRRAPTARFVGDDRGWQRKEVVIENDIAWRVQTMVDFMFGRPLTIASMAGDAQVRARIERVLERVWESSGGIALLQDMGLMGHVYGHVDLLVRVVGGMEGESQDVTPRGSTPAPRGSGGEGESEMAWVLERASGSVRIELIEPPRGVALVSESDYRELDGYVIRTRHEAEAPPAGGAEIAGKLMRWWKRGLEGVGAGEKPADVVTMTEVFAGSSRQMYETTPEGRTRMVDEGPSLVEERLGDRPPVVHIQNISQPFEYEGLGEVEPLIPLQDELNTRLSDRAARVTMQSFKMYLAKGLDGAASMPVAPGVIWATDNPDAQVTAFGGDAASPSEDRHIDEIREALDKASAVPPLASGVVRAKIGNLSSENALRITLLGLMSKTSRKRITYGRGIVRASQIVLEALDRLGILRTTPAERDLRVDWVDPIPRDEQQALAAAKAKVELGVPRERVLSELGYATGEDEDRAVD